MARNSKPAVPAYGAKRNPPPLLSGAQMCSRPGPLTPQPHTLDTESVLPLMADSTAITSGTGSILACSVMGGDPCRPAPGAQASFDVGAVSNDMIIPQKWGRQAAEEQKKSVILEIEQMGGIHDNLIFEMESGGVGCVIDLAITNQTCTPIYCVNVELRTPWEDDFFEWLRRRKSMSNSERNVKAGTRRTAFPGDWG